MKLSFTFLCLICMNLALAGCKTTIPATDTIPPEFTFQIRGDGFSHTFDQDTDFADIQLNLRNNTPYNFTLTGSDEGGVKQIRWQYAGDNLEFEDPIELPWRVRDISFLTRIVEFNGDRDEPRTGGVLSGRFRVREVPNTTATSVAYKFWVRDFGGQDGATNTTFSELTILIDDHETEIIEF